LTRTSVRLRRLRLGRATATILTVLALLVLGQLSVSDVAARPHAQAGTIVRCNPPTVLGSTSQTLTVDLYVQDVSALYGIDLTATFDPTIAQVVDENSAADVQILPGTFLQPDFLVRNAADNFLGTIRYAATQVAPTAPAEGSGPVARVRFTAVHGGQFTLAFAHRELSDRDGVLISNEAQGCTITFQSPTAVTLAGFEAAPRKDGVLIAWETASEIDTLGFNLSRSDARQGIQAQLNAAIILAQTPGVSSGAWYSWPDHDCVPGSTYYYWLEVVDLKGRTVSHDPVSALCGEPTAVSLHGIDAARVGGAGLWIVPVLGGAAVFFGLRRRRQAR
jgi:hypothetical protein